MFRNKCTNAWCIGRQRKEGDLMVDSQLWGLSPEVGVGAVGGAARWEGEEGTGKLTFRPAEFLAFEEQSPECGSRRPGGHWVLWVWCQH